ncbi:MAG: hypothetical protein UX94_C0001G0038 [Parcubacteria group bacterium GW2011_GWA2_47_21]|nr:MAG: hypothetical protein UX94_C0001G0038 [Parcubacteria group bacterium GW2011_GWA2_47_21]
MAYYILVGVFALLMVPGLVFVFSPLMPAIPYMFVVAIVFGFIDGWQHVTLANFGILGLIVAFAVLIDHLAGLLGAKYGGASKKALAGGLAGLLTGTALLPPFGGFLGLFLAVFFIELINHRREKSAFRAALGALIGSATGVAANVFLAFLFIVLFLLFSLL